MLGDIAFQIGPEVTEATLEGLVAGVGDHVGLQVGLLVAAVRTEWAGVGLLNRMRDQMPFQVAVIVGGVVAIGALLHPRGKGLETRPTTALEVAGPEVLRKIGARRSRIFFIFLQRRSSAAHSPQVVQDLRREHYVTGRIGDKERDSCYEDGYQLHLLPITIRGYNTTCFNWSNE